MYAEKILHILKNYVEREFNGNVTAAGSYFGINPHTLRRWLLGDRTPTLNELGKALDLMGIDVPEHGERLEGYDMVPKVTARAGAGSSLITSDEVLGYYAFRRDFLNRVGIHRHARRHRQQHGTAHPPQGHHTRGSVGQGTERRQNLSRWPR